MGNSQAAQRIQKGDPVDVLANKVWYPGVVESVDSKGGVFVAITYENQRQVLPISRKSIKSRLAMRGQHTANPTTPGLIPVAQTAHTASREPDRELSPELVQRQGAMRAKAEREAELMEEARAKARARPRSSRSQTGVEIQSEALDDADTGEVVAVARAVPDAGSGASGRLRTPVAVPMVRSQANSHPHLVGLTLDDNDMAAMYPESPDHLATDGGMVQFIDVLDKSVPLAAPAPKSPHRRDAGKDDRVPQTGWRWRPAAVLNTTDDGKVSVRFLDTDSQPNAYSETGQIDIDDSSSFSAYETMSSPHLVHHSYQVGDVLDVEDRFLSKNGKRTIKRWRKCQVVAISGQYFIRVTFVGWSNFYDEWFHVLEQADRLAPFASHTESGLESNAGLDGVFERNLQKDRKLTVFPVEPDGNCLFRAVAHQVYGDPERHDIVRSDCCDYLEKNRNRFAPLLGSDQFDQYVENKRQLKVWGDDPEIRAMEELYDRPIEIYTATGLGSNTEPLKLHFDGDLPSDREMGPYIPIRLSFHGNNHYNSVIPYVCRQERDSSGHKYMADISADAWDPPEMRLRGVIRKFRNVLNSSRRHSGLNGFRLATQDLDDVDDDGAEGKYAN